MSIEYETVRCENGETVPKDDYSGYCGCGGYAIRGPEDKQLAGRLDALLEKGDYPAIDRLLENADRTERDHATAIYKRVLERRNRLAECDDRALAVISGMVEEYLLDARAATSNTSTATSRISSSISTRMTSPAKWRAEIWSVRSVPRKRIPSSSMRMLRKTRLRRLCSSERIRRTDQPHVPDLGQSTAQECCRRRRNRLFEGNTRKVRGHERRHAQNKADW